MKDIKEMTLEEKKQYARKVVSKMNYPKWEEVLLRMIELAEEGNNYIDGVNYLITDEDPSPLAAFQLGYIE